MCRILLSILKRTLNVEYAFFNNYDRHTRTECFENLWTEPKKRAKAAHALPAGTEHAHSLTHMNET